VSRYVCQTLRISAAQARDYKSVTDSNVVKLDEQVTCLVGKNESGKTAFLEAMYRWNPVETGHHQTFLPLRDFPRARWSKEREQVPSLEPITLRLALEQSDYDLIEKKFGAKVVTAGEIRRSRKYNNQWNAFLHVDEAAYVKARVAQAGLDRATADGCDTVAQLVTKLQAAEDPSVKMTELAEELDGYDLSGEVRGYLRTLYPRFLYFDEYSVMPGRVSIPRLQQHPDDLDTGERTALALLKLAGVDTDDFDEDDYETRRAALEAASTQITQEVFEYWSQNTDLLVELDLDFKSPPGPRTGETPPFLEIRIRNLRHGVTLNFGERSAGFVWFFSFLVAFSEYRDEDRLALLLDEPGLGLHAAAQADLLRYIDERLAPNHQVVYSTHSPFLVDPTHLDRVRTVEDVDGEGTKIGDDVLSTNRDTVFPLQAALGYELAQTLFVGPDNIVVEGPADYLYLEVMSDHLRSLGRQHLDDRWVIVPVGGLDKIPTFVALLGAQLNVVVVMDAAAGGSQKVNSLIDKKVIQSKQVIPLDTIVGSSEADIEDLFDPAFYLRLLKDSGTTGAVAKTKLGDSDRIIKRVEAAIGKPFDHYRPARHLLENQASLLKDIDEQTIDRFEKLFVEINSRLS
jgi:hypothetical protein